MTTTIFHCLNNHITRWRPLTCPCIIEYDENVNWKNTINKCELHKEFTGKTLLEEVMKHNRENSPKGEPNTMEGIIGFIFEPDWRKQVSKYPSNEKLQEAKFNLNMAKEYHSSTREFQYCLSNFLNTSTSILWYLLEEYSRKFEVDIPDYRRNKEYREKYEGKLSLEAKEFLTWYDTEFASLKDDKVGFLLNKRNDNTHAEYVVLIFEQKQPFKINGSSETEIPVDWSKLYAFFPENKEMNAIESCESFVVRIKLLVDSAHERFPL